MGLHPRLPGLISDREPSEAVPSTPVATEAEGHSRRGFLARIAAGGAALTLGSQLLPLGSLSSLSGAQEADVSDLTDDDLIVRFLASVGLAGSAAYQAAVALPGVTISEPVVEILRSFGFHHAQQGAALAGLLPITFEDANATLVDQQTQVLEAAGDQAGVLTALIELEEAVAATHLAALEELVLQADAQLVAAALPICAQHAVVLGSLNDLALAELVPETQTTDGALARDAFPIEAEDAPATTAPTDETTTTAASGDGGDGTTADTTEPAGADVQDEG